MATTRANATVDDTAKLQAEIETLRKDLADVTSTLKSLGSNTAREKVEAASAKIREVGDQARDQFDHAREAAAGQVRERPLTTVAVTFGVGLLIGRLLQK